MLMRQLHFAWAVLGIVLLGPVPAFGGKAELLLNCDVCTCTSGDIVCLDVEGGGEVVEEQVICGIACQNIGSTHGSRERFEGACAELPQCNGLSAPAANAYWMTAAALGLLLFGVVTVRRMGRQAAA